MNAIAKPQAQEAEANYERSSPTLLSQQPPQPTKPKKDQKDWMRIYEHLESNLNALRMWRYSWWTYWQQLARYLLPRRYKFLVTANTMWRGNAINNAIVDSTGTQAMLICASGLWSGLTSPSRPWFKLGIAFPWVELDRDSQAWLADTGQRLYTVLQQSNFYNIFAQMFQDVSVFGTSPPIIYEDSENVVHLFLPVAGEYYLSVGAKMNVDTLYREFTYTVKQIVDFFGLDNCAPAVQKLWQEGGGSWQNEFVIGHAIEPNSALSPWGRAKSAGAGPVQVVPGGFPFREVYWMRGQGAAGELSRKGFHERPFVAARWATTANDAYGRSPGMDVLGDVQQLQLETARKAEFIEKLVRPPMVGDVGMKNEPSSILPGHVTYADMSGGRKGFIPAFQVEPQALSPMVQDLQEIRQRIKDGFFTNLFMAISQMEGVQPRNQLELTKRDLERLQQLGPFIHQFETEVAGPTIQRIIRIMHRRKLLKPMPAQLAKIPLAIKYQSIMRLAQASAEGVGLKDFLNVGASLSGAAKAAGVPDPLRIINLDEALRRYGELSNVDPELIFTLDEVHEHDAARQKAEAGVQAVQAVPGATEAAHTMSQTPMGGNTLLSALVGGGAAPGA